MQKVEQITICAYITNNWALPERHRECANWGKKLFFSSENESKLFRCRSCYSSHMYVNAKVVFDGYSYNDQIVQQEMKFQYLGI